MKNEVIFFIFQIHTPENDIESLFSSEKHKKRSVCNREQDEVINYEFKVLFLQKERGGLKRKKFNLVRVT